MSRTIDESVALPGTTGAAGLSTPLAVEESGVKAIAMDAHTPQERNALDLVNRKVGAGQSLEEIMDFLFEQTREVYPCDRLSLALLEENGSRVVSYWARSTYDPLWLSKGFSQDLKDTSLQTVIDHGTPRIIPDLVKYLACHPKSVSTGMLVEEGVRSSLTCPLVVEGRPVGFLFRSARRTNAYGPREVSMHLAIAERLGQAVEKASRIAELDAANHAYFEVLGFVGHELRSPVASIAMDLQALATEQFGPLRPEQEYKLGRMAGKLAYLLSLIDDYMNLARVESSRLEFCLRHDVDLDVDVFRRAYDLLETDIESKEITLVEKWASKPFLISGDPALLTIAVANLLSNAVKYSNQRGEVAFIAEKTEGSTRIKVRNTGPGFPPDQKKRLFRRFSRLQTPELLERKGSGIGLYTTWRIVQLHGGRIWADSKPGEWAEFCFEIPRHDPAEPRR